MRPWYFRHARNIVYCGVAVAAGGVLLASLSGRPGVGEFLVSARQLFGLWALGFLLASMALGPLLSVFAWIPLKSVLLYARRAIGVGAFLFALTHVACYLAAVWLRSWRELYTPGVLWVIGLLLGALAMADLTVLAVTSRDAAVKTMGGRRWKRVHQSVYVALGIVLVHALCTGADFGLNRGPDVRGDPDAGSGVAFLCVSVAWLILFVLRRKRISWRPRFAVPRSASQ